MRPTTAKVTTWLMGFFAACWWLALYFRRDDEVGVVIGAVIFAISSFFAYKVLSAYWRGENWARQVVIVTSIFIIAQFPTDKPWPAAPLQAISWAKLGLAAFLPLYLNSREARTFFGALYQERGSAVAQQ